VAGDALPALWIVVALVAFVWIGHGNPIDGALTAINMVTRGERLTYAAADSTGYVDADPQSLADQAGLTQEQYSLARMLGSEEPHSSPETQAAIAWATINKAARRGISITDLLLQAKNAKNNGHYGSQKDKDPTSPNFGSSDRYATTALDPYDREGQIAQQCLDGTIPDPTGGATNYDRPAGEKNPDKVATDRGNEGLVAVDVPSADEGLRFWRPV
jgi:hypothetical protein